MKKYKNYIGLGIAGNFAGHLEQAGEAGDFKNVVIKDLNAPKGLFPFYVPSNNAKFIEKYPISSSLISKPDNCNLQPEPEIALLCQIIYDSKHKVDSIIPKYFGAYNDCSIRKPNINKISQKKNWGANSKGLSSTLIKIDQFHVGGIMDSYRLASFIIRKEQIIEYGVDSPLNDYSYFHQKLLNWTIETMNTQVDSGPLENISQLLKDAKYPKDLILSIGATQYTQFGQSNFLQNGDQLYIICYDASSLKNPMDLIKNPNHTVGLHSILKQTVL